MVSHSTTRTRGVQKKHWKVRERLLGQGGSSTEEIRGKKKALRNWGDRIRRGGELSARIAITRPHGKIGPADRGGGDLPRGMLKVARKPARREGFGGLEEGGGRPLRKRG